jgi:hypothetical protein
MGKGKHLGDLSSPRAERTETFGWFGQTFNVHPNLSDLTIVEFMEMAVNIDEADELRASQLVLEQLKMLVHPDQWDEFMRLSKANRQNVQDLMELMNKLTTALGKGRGKQPSGSAIGRSRGREKPKRSASGRVIKHLENKGRPDLAAVVAMARDEQQSG